MSQFAVLVTPAAQLIHVISPFVNLVSALMNSVKHSRFVCLFLANRITSNLLVRQGLSFWTG
jgi:hypothetical protein